MMRMGSIRSLLYQARELHRQWAGLPDAVRLLRDVACASHRAIEAMHRATLQATLARRAERVPVTVLLLGETIREQARYVPHALDGRPRAFVRDVEREPLCASKTVWLSPGAQEEVRFTLYSPLARGAWVIVLGGGLLSQLRVGDRECFGSIPSLGSVGQTHTAAAIGVDILCRVQLGELSS